MKRLNSDFKGTYKIPVTFNNKQLEYIDQYKGILGEKRAEVVRNIVLNWILIKEEKAIK